MSPVTYYKSFLIGVISILVGIIHTINVMTAKSLLCVAYVFAFVIHLISSVTFTTKENEEINDTYIRTITIHVILIISMLSITAHEYLLFTCCTKYTDVDLLAMLLLTTLFSVSLELRNVFEIINKVGGLSDE